MLTHRQVVRAGWAWVGVSAQRVGIEGGGGIFESAAEPGDGSPLPTLPALKVGDPARYGGLHHPGDAFCFDIFTRRRAPSAWVACSGRSRSSACWRAVSRSPRSTWSPTSTRWRRLFLRRALDG